MVVLALLVLLFNGLIVESLDTNINVVELTNENFDEKMDEGVWFLKISVPWCSHCRKMEGIWELVATTLKKQNINVGNDCVLVEDYDASNNGKVLAKGIDGMREKLLSARFQPEGYPAIYYLRDGECREYRLQRTTQELIDFAVTGWQNVDPWPFYRAPNGPFGGLIGFWHSIPLKVDSIHNWLHIELGLPNLMILGTVLSVPVVLGLAMICLMDHLNSNRGRTVVRPHTD